MADDLKNLGRRSWIEGVSTDKKKTGLETDSGVVTRYAAVDGQSVDELQTLVGRDPDNLELKDMLAFTLYSNERIDDAIAVFKDLLNRRHNVNTQRLYLGNCYYKKKLYNLAVKEWEHVFNSAEADDDLKERARSRIERVKQGIAIEFT